MPLYRVGKSNVSFRETGKRSRGPKIIEAERVFPELGQLDWPERGSRAERISLLKQAGKYVKTKAPQNLKEACGSLVNKYPCSRPLKCLRGDQWDTEAVEAEIHEICVHDINLKASPGVPMALFGTTNKSVLSVHEAFIRSAVVERLEALSAVDLEQLNLSPCELVQLGYCDPVRLFVKQEPHTKKKLDEGRYRLISSVSVVDQLIERLMFGPQNRLEIQRWRNIPSKPGMGLSMEEQVRSIWSELETYHSRCPAAEADISGFDWSVQDWELWADLAMRIQLGNFGPKLQRAAKSRFYCFMNSVFQLSDGTLIAQGLPGLMKSGSYCTSSTNSRIRCLMAELIGSPWCIAMGDDSVEGYVPRAKELYSAMGHSCKEYIPCETDADGELVRVNFCSHEISRETYWLTSWPKTLFRYLDSPDPHQGELEAELSRCPLWGRIRRYVGIGDCANKDGEAKETSSAESRRARSGSTSSAPAPDTCFVPPQWPQDEYPQDGPSSIWDRIGSFLA